MELHDAVFVQMHDRVAVPIDEVFSYSDQHDRDTGYPSPHRVYWRDGTWSYAHGRWDSLTNMLTMVIVGQDPLLYRADEVRRDYPYRYDPRHGRRAR